LLKCPLLDSCFPHVLIIAYHNIACGSISFCLMSHEERKGKMKQVREGVGKARGDTGEKLKGKVEQVEGKIEEEVGKVRREIEEEDERADRA
jgi:uncharacterized protein YjbJ (UPF0337 family)